jgi:SAM-dependent methyltransferase
MAVGRNSVPSLEAFETSRREARLNLGCGAQAPRGFINVDLRTVPGAIQHDLTRGIPFPDSSFDLVYHATMLSQLRPPDAARLMVECQRVLKPGGVLRIVTENLEEMCRIYLEKLEAAWAGDRLSAEDYDWMILEMYDQATRESPGGDMTQFLARDPLPNEAFVRSRIGEQVRHIIAGARAAVRRREQAAGQRAPHVFSLGQLLEPLRAQVLREERRAFDIGRFRLCGGEASHRMYDRFSLRRLFLQAGFSGVVLRNIYESYYPQWREVNLDVTTSGAAARPHTLIMEGIRR